MIGRSLIVAALACLLAGCGGGGRLVAAPSPPAVPRPTASPVQLASRDATLLERTCNDILGGASHARFARDERAENRARALVTVEKLLAQDPAVRPVAGQVVSICGRQNVNGQVLAADLASS